LGLFEDNVLTPDFAELVQSYLNSPSFMPEPDGSRLVPLTIYSSSPGILKINEVKLTCSFIIHISTFSDGSPTKSIFFDAINVHRSIYITLPKPSNVLNATLKLDDMLTNERVAVYSVNEANIHGFTISPRYLAAQEFKIDRYLPITRISLNLAKIKDDTELRLEIWTINENIQNDEFNKMYDHDIKAEGNILSELITSTSIKANNLADDYTWVDIKLDKIILKPDTCYWMVLRAAKGEALWHADDECPVGGLLRTSQNNGRKWYSHKMDGLFKICFETDLLTPTLLIHPGQDFQAPELESVELELNLHEPQHLETNTGPKILNVTGLLNDYLSKCSKFEAITCEVPLTFSSECIGSLEISDLDIECEVDSLAPDPDIGQNSISLQLKFIMDNLNILRTQVNAIHERLPEEILKQKLKAPLNLVSASHEDEDSSKLI